MATAKKTTTKRTAAKKPAVAQKTAVKKQSVSKPVVKKTAAPQANKQPKMESFHVSKERFPFMTFKITDQTIYWSILLIYIMLIILWISNIQLETLRIINSINAG